MPRGGYLLEDLRVVRRVQADGKKDGLGAVRGERGQHRWGILWPRPVVELSPSRRKSWDLKCSKPNPGPPVVSISTTREIPIASGLPGQEVATRGAAAGAGAGAAAGAAGTAGTCGETCAAATVGEFSATIVDGELSVASGGEGGCAALASVGEASCSSRVVITEWACPSVDAACAGEGVLAKSALRSM